MTIVVADSYKRGWKKSVYNNLAEIDLCHGNWEEIRLDGTNTEITFPAHVPFETAVNSLKWHTISRDSELEQALKGLGTGYSKSRLFVSLAF